MAITVDPTIQDRVIATAGVLTSTTYRTCFFNINDVANVIGGGAGAAVATTVTFSPPLPVSVTSYNVQVTPNQDAVPYVTSKTTTGFTFTLNPRLAANTLAVGTSDIRVSWNV